MADVANIGRYPMSDVHIGTSLEKMLRLFFLYVYVLEKNNFRSLDLCCSWACNRLSVSKTEVGSYSLHFHDFSNYIMISALLYVVIVVAGRLRPFLPLTKGMQSNYEIHARLFYC